MESDSKHSGTNASGPGPRLEDRFAQVAKAFEGLKPQEAVDLSKRLWQNKVLPLAEEFKDLFRPSMEELRAAVKTAQGGKPYTMRLNELCAQRRYGEPAFLERASAADSGKWLCVVTVTYVKESDIKKPHAQATASTKVEAKEAACKLLYAKLTA